MAALFGVYKDPHVKINNPLYHNARSYLPPITFEPLLVNGGGTVAQLHPTYYKGNKIMAHDTHKKALDIYQEMMEFIPQLTESLREETWQNAKQEAERLERLELHRAAKREELIRAMEVDGELSEAAKTVLAEHSIKAK